jgi:aminopeptidase N
LNTANIPELNPVKQWSKIRMDAGIGTALTIKKFGPFEKIQPITIRFDMPLFLNSPPFAKPDYVSWRWVLGVSRAF